MRSSLRKASKQGCPLSPLLFNLVLEGILPHVHKMDGGYEFGNGAKAKILAYADDICVIGRSKEEIERILEKVHNYTQWAGLKFNPIKCGCLSMINRGSRKYVDNFQPLLGSDHLQSIKWGEKHKYLGVQRGRTVKRSPVKMKDTITKEAETICNSALTDWQKLDALNTFVMTKVFYHLNASIVDRSWCQQVDACVR